jgi:Domain of unknown function (DUF3846)
MGIVIVIPADAQQAIRSRETDTQPPLQELQDIVDGYIEAVPHWDDYMGKPCVVYCNEEGKLRDLPVNKRATDLWWGKLGGGIYDDVLCGDIVLVVDLPDKEDDDE